MLNGMIKLFYSEVVKVNINKMSSSDYIIREELRNLNDVTLKIDSFIFKLIKIIFAMIFCFIGFEINLKLGIGILLTTALYFIYKKMLENQIKIYIRDVKNNVSPKNIDFLTQKSASGLNILVTLLIIGFLTDFNFSIIISFTIVFLFTIKDICSNIK